MIQSIVDVFRSIILFFFNDVQHQQTLEISVDAVDAVDVIATYRYFVNVKYVKVSHTIFSRTFSIVLRPSHDIPACS